MKKNPDEQIMAAKAFATLSDKTSLDIANRVEGDDLSFTELQKSTNLDKNSLYYKIKKLIKSGIVVNYYQKRENTSEYSFYKITSFGKRILKQLEIPPTKKRTVTEKQEEIYDLWADITKLYEVPTAPDYYISEIISQLNKSNRFECEKSRELYKSIFFFKGNWNEFDNYKIENRRKMELI